jgi:hypothetical protein
MKFSPVAARKKMEQWQRQVKEPSGQFVAWQYFLLDRMTLHSPARNANLKP